MPRVRYASGCYTAATTSSNELPFAEEKFISSDMIVIYLFKIAAGKKQKIKTCQEVDQDSQAH